ncbi:MAG: aldo/keto reductase [Paracoccaceae bacterium]
MEIRPLGRSGLTTTHFCLGTMTFGSNTPEDDAFAQLDMAVDAGITLLDAAEMYPVNPVLKETVGNTEAIIGRWRGARGAAADRLQIATKCSGANNMMVRDGATVTPASMRGALEDSLRRLQTETVDLYQLHWPSRGSYHFRQYWGYEPQTQNSAKALDELAALVGCVSDLVAEGKIRAFGQSNESAWGLTRWQAMADAIGGTRICAVQNEYNLLCRLFDTDCAEACHHEGIGLLAFSPLAAGILTGKYSGNAIPTPSRRTNQPDLGGRATLTALEAADAYGALAQKHGLDPVHMALAFCTSRPLMASTIIGATTSAQLERILKGADLTLTAELLAEIGVIYKKYPRPM